jgi:hypothetical protein
VTGGERPPLLDPVGGGSPASPCSIYRQHRKAGARNQSDEIAGVIRDLEGRSAVRLQSLMNVPSLDRKRRAEWII